MCWEILIVQNFTEMPPGPSEEMFMILIFTEWEQELMHNAQTTPLPIDCHVPK